MNKTKFSLFAIMVCLLLSCNSDPCKDLNCQNGGICFDGTCNCVGGWQGPECEDGSCMGVNCLNGGTCQSGTCECPLPWYGPTCDSLIDNRFRGMYEVSGDCTPNSYFITFSVQPNQLGELLLNNLQENALQLRANATSETSLNIPEQTLNGTTYTGSVTWVDSQNLTIDYSLDNTTHCSILLNRF